MTTIEGQFTRHEDTTEARVVPDNATGVVYDAGRINLYLPDLAADGVVDPPIVAFIGFFHRINTDKDFLIEMAKYVTDNPEVANMFGISVEVKQ